MRRRPINKAVAYSLIMIFLASVTSALAAIMYAKHVDNESNQRWCGLVVRLDDTYREKPPGTELGRDIATEFQKLRHDFGCNN